MQDTAPPALLQSRAALGARSRWFLKGDFEAAADRARLAGTGAVRTAGGEVKRWERCLWMTTELAKRAFENRQIIKSELSYDHRGKFVSKIMRIVYRQSAVECNPERLG